MYFIKNKEISILDSSLFFFLGIPEIRLEIQGPFKDSDLKYIREDKYGILELVEYSYVKSDEYTGPDCYTLQGVYKRIPVEEEMSDEVFLKLETNPSLKSFL
jgi:hypothetical protein